MSRIARTLPKPALAVLVALAILFAGNPPVRGDIGRNGGIVILPSARHVSQWASQLIPMSVLFGNGSDVALQLSNVSNVVIVAGAGNGPSVPGSISGSVATFRAVDLRALYQAGARDLRICLIDSEMFGYDLRMRLSENGTTVEIR